MPKFTLIFITNTFLERNQMIWQRFFDLSLCRSRDLVCADLGDKMTLKLIEGVPSVVWRTLFHQTHSCDVCQIRNHRRRPWFWLVLFSLPPFGSWSMTKCRGRLPGISPSTSLSSKSLSLIPLNFLEACENIDRWVYLSVAWVSVWMEPPQCLLASPALHI